MRQQRNEYPPLAENIGFGKWHIRYDVKQLSRNDERGTGDYYDYEEFELIFDNENQILFAENINSELVDYALIQIASAVSTGVEVIQLEDGIRTSASDIAVGKLVTEGKTIITVQ